MQTETMTNEEEIFFEEEEDQEIESQPLSELIPELKQIREIVVSGSDWTTATILDQLLRNNIQLTPRFQRRDAWDITLKSRFIESLILGFPVPQIVPKLYRKPPQKSPFFSEVSGTILVLFVVLFLWCVHVL